MNRDKINNLLFDIKKSFDGESFVKLSLANHVGADPDLKKILVKPALIKRILHASVTYRYKTKDIVKNYLPPEFITVLSPLIADFMTGSLQVVGKEICFEFKKDKLIIKEKIDASIISANLSHDTDKQRLLSKSSHFLTDLGVTDQDGKVLQRSQDKFRQINKFVEVLAPHFKSWPADKEIHITDMGSGKGYLTFALYDYLKNTLALDVYVTGVEMRQDMVELCNNIAQKNSFVGLNFIRSNIQKYKAENIDVLIALHACDTATDDALLKAVGANATLIVVAPCCHKQVRREMEKSNYQAGLEPLLRHGIFLERQAEMVTDGLRALALEYCGYSTKAFEFISDAHTPKNVMIIADKNTRARNEKEKSDIFNKIEGLKKIYGIDSFALRELLPIK